MLAALDVAYDDVASKAAAACVCFAAWDSAVPSSEVTAPIPSPQHYVPGAFYQRELPCLLAVLALLPALPGILIIDGYVTLGAGRPGLGAHLHQSLGGRAAIVGVAKTPFRDNGDAVAVVRGSSRSPLFVTSLGVDLAQAVLGVTSMAGPFRVPALLRRADALCRAALASTRP